MATFEDLKSGSVRAAVCVNGIRDGKTFKDRSKAKRWAKEREVELSKLDKVVDNTRTFADMFERYSKEVSPQKKGSHWEILRLELFLREYTDLCSAKLVKSKKDVIKAWMDLRSKSVMSSTINRELNIISNCLTIAREEWGWLSHNPMQGLKRPKDPKHRERRISEEEIEMLCMALGYREDTTLKLKREFVAVAFLFAIETAMRAGEICSLTISDINFETKVAHLDKTKNGDERDVPLSDRAIALLRRLPTVEDGQPIFQMTSGALSSNFRKYKKKTPIEDLTFHDSRHEATTRLASKVHVLALAKVTGHRDIKQLMTYYNEDAADIAKQINGASVQSMANGDTVDLNLLTQLIQQLSQAQQLSQVQQLSQAA